MSATSKIVTICAFVALVTLSMILLYFYHHHAGGGTVRRSVLPTVSAEEDEKRLLARKPTIWNVEMGQSKFEMDDFQPIAASLTYYPSPYPHSGASRPASPTPSVITFSVLILPPSPPPSAHELAARRAKWMSSSDSGDDDDTPDGEEVPEVEIGVSTTRVFGEPAER